MAITYMPYGKKKLSEYLLYAQLQKLSGLQVIQNRQDSELLMVTVVISMDLMG